MKKYYYKDLKIISRKLTSGFCDIQYISPKEISSITDLYNYFKLLSKKIGYKKRLVVIYYNHLWEPLLKIATRLGWRHEYKEENWLDQEDIKNLLELTGFEVIMNRKRILIPINIPVLTKIVNNYISNLPIINNLCLTTYTVARKSADKPKEYSVSIIIPARNEAGNIPKIVPSIPKFGKKQEIIFVEGHSTDNTWQEIIKLKTLKRSKVKIRAFRQNGRGKNDAVRLGFSKAHGDILIIYDADRTVNAKDLPKFYDTLASGRAEFVNGSRLVYPMEKDAMRTLNKIGNKFFSVIFTWILGQRFKDTLCGTKALFRCDYLDIAQYIKRKGSDDPFGDFDLIFGSIRKNLKILEIPVRYKERVYGSTNINRILHGLLLFKMTWIAYKEFRAW